MPEALRNLTMLLWIGCALNSGMVSAHAQGVQEENTAAANAPTIIVGRAAQADGGEDETVVEQPAGAENPLGDPLSETAAPTATTADVPVAAPVQAAAAVPKVSSDENTNAETLGKQFQNTLMEANGMVYDVQAYPVEDLQAIGNSSNPETIYSPNVNP